MPITVKIVHSDGSVEILAIGCTCFRDGEVTIRDPWCPIHKEYLFEYESKPE